MQLPFFFLIFIYLLAVSGLSCGTWDFLLRCTGSSLVVSRGLQSSWPLQLQLAGSVVVVHGLSSCGTPAQLSRSMWDLSSLTRDGTSIPCIARRILNHWNTREVPQLLNLAKCQIVWLRLTFMNISLISIYLAAKLLFFSQIYSF